MSAASPVIPAPTGSKRPMAAGLSSICRMGLYGAIPVWLAKEAPTTISRSASFISQLATGVPLRPSTPAPSGWVSGIRPLALKVVRTGALSRSARSRSGPAACRAPCPAISTGRLLAEIMAAARASSGWLGWVEPSGQPALRGLGGGVTGLGLDLVRQHQVGDAAGVQGMLDRQGGQLGMVAAGVHLGGPGGYVAEDGGQVEILEGPPPEDLGGNLAGDGQDR